jgi:hypothetical protein
MDYIIFIAIVVVAVLAILFWPKKKKGTQDHEDDFDTKKKQNSTKQHGIKGSKKSIKKPAQKANKPSKEDLKQKKNDSAELTDDELLQSMDDTLADKEFLKSFDKALSDTGDDFTKEEAAAEEVRKSSKITSNEKKPEIKMDSEEPVKSTRMRKKLVQESAAEVKKDDTTSGMQFIGADVRGIETPSIDDLFADPSVNENNYQDMLFKATKEITPDADAIAIGMPTIKEEKTDIPKEEPEQVSEDLEPIGKENTANEPLKDTVEKSMEELVEEPAKESTEDPVEKSTEELAEKPANESTEDSVEEPADESTEDPAEKSTEESAGEYTEEPANKPAEEPANKPAEESIEESVEPKDTFVPGSEHFDNSGLQFASRPHLEKSTHLLPEELTPEESKDGIELTVESPNVKAPINNNGLIELYNSHIYKDGKPLPWDIRFEVQLKEDEELTVDTGVGIKLPNGFGIKIIPVENIESKFGLKVISSLDVSRLEAQYSLKFVIRSVGLSSYIAKNQPLIRLKIFRI